MPPPFWIAAYGGKFRMGLYFNTNGSCKKQTAFYLNFASWSFFVWYILLRLFINPQNKQRGVISLTCVCVELLVCLWHHNSKTEQKIYNVVFLSERWQDRECSYFLAFIDIFNIYLHTFSLLKIFNSFLTVSLLFRAFRIGGFNYRFLFIFKLNYIFFSFAAVIAP